MIKIRQTVVVEGKYDKIKLSSLLDTTIIETGGFKIFKDKEKLALLRLLAKTTGLLVLTDSDSAGFKIRGYLKSTIPEGEINHAYIPDILGKEKRKLQPSKEGKLGVEGMEQAVLIKALQNAGVIDYKEQQAPARKIERIDLYHSGLTGKQYSKQLRKDFLSKLGLPVQLSTSAMLEIINTFISFDEYSELMNDILKNHTI